MYFHTSALINFLLFIISFLVKHATAQFNVSIDDTNGDELTGTQITYSPSNQWQTGQDCESCTAKVDSTQVYDNTWHDTTFYPSGSITDNAGTIVSASVSFTGSAVYVYCILTGSTYSPDGNTDFTFILDGSTVGTYEKVPDGDSTYLYGQIVFAKTGLDEVSHTISIESGHNGTKSLFLLDRIVYTTTNSSTSTSGSPSSSSTQSSSSQNLSTSFSAPASSTTSSATTKKSATTTSSSKSGTNTGTTATQDSTWSLSSMTYTAPTSTTVSGDTSNTSHSNINMIAGIAVGSVCALLLATLLLWWLRRKHRREEVEEAEKAIIPFFSNPRTGAVNFGSDFDGSSGRITSPWSPQTSLESSNRAWNRIGLGAGASLNGAAIAATSSKANSKRSRSKSSGWSSDHPTASSVRSPETYQSSTRNEKARLAAAIEFSIPARPPRARRHNRDRDGSRPLPSTPSSSRKTSRVRRGVRTGKSPFSPTPLYESSSTAISSGSDSCTVSSGPGSMASKYCPFERNARRKKRRGTTRRDRVRVDRAIDEEGDGAGEIIVGDKEGIPTEDFTVYGSYSVPLAPVRPSAALLKEQTTSIRPSEEGNGWQRRLRNMLAPISRTNTLFPSSGQSRKIDTVPVPFHYDWA